MHVSRTFLPSIPPRPRILSTIIVEHADAVLGVDLGACSWSLASSPPPSPTYLGDSWAACPTKNSRAPQCACCRLEGKEIQ
mmetsp:Transcript_131444/g.227634  ORF Transcript_131444/g.227634 Transcript_131444/m.227634 type:complete len:81 (+) Transcript_131444:714-956(+)